jgi:integrase
MKLNQAAAAALRLPAGQSETIVFDDTLKGFGVRLRAGGKRTWILQYRVGRQQRRQTIGSLDLIPAARARATAERALAEVMLGSDPQAQKAEQRARAAETVEVIAARYLTVKKRELRPRSYESVETHIQKHWSPFQRLPIHAVTRRQVAARLSEIGAERGLVAANRARSTLSACFAWAIREGLVDANPVAGTNKQTDEETRDRVLGDDELVSIWRACRDDHYGCIVRILIATGQRRSEVGSALKSEIAARKWSLPGERTKNHLPHDVPLSDLAVGIFERAIVASPSGRDLIFGESDERGFSGWSAAKAALDRRIEELTKAEVKSWRLHDLRRTVATRLADLGTQPHIIEAVLNHVSGHKGGVAGVYNRAAYTAEKRQALDLWAAHLEALLAGKPASNIIALKA